MRHGTPSESHAAVHAIHKLLILIKESGHAEIQHSWWAELVVTFKTLLEQQAHREQALRAMRTFVLLLDVEQLARGLQQLRISSTYRTMHIKPYYTIPDPHTLVAFSRPREPTESGCLQKAVA